MTRTTCDSSSASAGQACKPREFNLVVVNEYNFNQTPISHIPWHDDKMNQPARNETDLLLTLVISISLGDTAIFSVMPNKDSPTFFEDMVTPPTGWVKNTLKWENARLNSRARFAFYLHHGDILLMTGKFQQIRQPY
jgi:alkylated DNA repair dioxygenase AlkB